MSGAIVYGTSPSPAIVSQFEGSIVNVVRWLDIYLPDNVTPWKQGVSMTAGSVSVDMTRDERRNIDVTFDAAGMSYGPGSGFWYDKILKPYRGIVLADGSQWVTQLGEFMPDVIDRARTGRVFHVTGRDFVKKSKLSKFSQTTTFTAGSNITDTAKNVMLNAGITKFAWTNSTKTLVGDMTYEAGSERFACVKDLLAGIGFEVFFDGVGNCTCRPYVDPTTAPLAYTFRDGAVGNLVDWSRSTNDTQMFNKVIVYGTGQTNALVHGEASNTAAGSPTRIAAIGERPLPWPSASVPDNITANATALLMLRVTGLESFEMPLTSIVLPWLEAGTAVEVQTSDAAVGDPTRFLMTAFTIPLDLTAMTATAKRVTNVG